MRAGETISAMVINVDPKERKIGLSVRGLKEKDEKEEVGRFMASQESAAPSLGRLIQEEMDKKAKKEEQDKAEKPEEPANDTTETPSGQGTQGEA